VLNICDVTVPRAVDTLTTAALVIVEAQNRVIEHVESIHAELDRHPFCNSEILQERRIGVEDTRSAVAENPDVTQIAASRVTEGTPTVFVISGTGVKKGTT
jgi:hypothetical protein